MPDNFSLSPEPISRPIPKITVAELDADPHGSFRRYREEFPFLDRSDGTFIVLRARDVEALITDPRTRQLETELIQSRGISSGPIFDMLGNSMLLSNGAVHRKRRSPMSRSFAFRAVAGLRPQIRAVAETLIDARLAHGQMNLLDDYTALIPARAVAGILGLPEEDVPSFTGWVYSFSRSLNTFYGQADIPDIARAAGQLQDYVERLIAQRRAAPRDDFLTDFIRLTDDAGELSPLESIAQVVFVILAGSDTTRAAMAIQVAMLLQDRAHWNAVCTDPTLIPGAVSEGLRYEPSVGSLPRFTRVEIEIDGYVVPAGRVLSLSTLSAMRDPAVYADPDRFDIRRTDHPRWHMVFGGGPHRCLGEALARLELEEGLAALAARLPGLKLTGEPLRLHGSSGIRRIDPLYVTWAR